MPLPRDLEDRLTDVLGRPPSEFGRDTPLSDLMLDSFAFVELALELELEHGIVLAEDEMGSLQSVGDLLTALEAAAQHRSV